MCGELHEGCADPAEYMTYTLFAAVPNAILRAINGSSFFRGHLELPQKILTFFAAATVRLSPRISALETAGVRGMKYAIGFVRKC